MYNIGDLVESYMTRELLVSSFGEKSVGATQGTIMEGPTASVAHVLPYHEGTRLHEQTARCFRLAYHSAEICFVGSTSVDRVASTWVMASQAGEMVSRGKHTGECIYPWSACSGP
jgi:hypothetical protein